MKDLNGLLEAYITYCSSHKRLDKKTIKAYRIDLRQFIDSLHINGSSELSEDGLNAFIALLHIKYKAKTVKRKIASIKTFIGFLNENEYLDDNYHKVFKILSFEPLPSILTMPL